MDDQWKKNRTFACHGEARIEPGLVAAAT